MSINQAIQSLCKKLKTNKNVTEKADYFLRKLDRKRRNFGREDQLKYLICIDLAYRDLGQKWDINIANKLGLRSKQYNNIFNRIQTILNISKNKTVSFEQLAKQFRCKHIQSQFNKKFKTYQTQKLNELPIVQQKYANFTTAAHKAAIFYIVATKLGKVTVNETELCNVMRCDKTQFGILCTDVRDICFPRNTLISNNNNNSRKRKRIEMETEYENDDMFCDEYEKRDVRKHKEWKEKVMKENEKKRSKKRKVSKRSRKMWKKVSNETPTKYFDIFEKTKKNAKKIENRNRNNSVIELKDDMENEDVDLKVGDNDDSKVENENNDNGVIINDANVNNNGNGNGNNVGVNTNNNGNGNRNKNGTAIDAARRAALLRMQRMMKMTSSTNDNGCKENDASIE